MDIWKLIGIVPAHVVTLQPFNFRLKPSTFDATCLPASGGALSGLTSSVFRGASQRLGSPFALSLLRENSPSPPHSITEIPVGCMICLASSSVIQRSVAAGPHESVMAISRVFSL